ncbi:hypothetical protein BHM03_00046620 [Ensete ventricosum]|nr:hypothetical protein BHM03_00046620 [Ensete ventricosum]
MKSGDGAGSGSATSSVANAHAVGDAGVSTAEKRPSSGAGAGLRKRLRKVAVEQPVDASGSTARTSADKGKGMMELEEVPERGTPFRNCASEDPLVPRWLTISGSSPFWTEGPLSEEYLRGLYTPALAKQVYECSSEEIMNRADKSAVWVRNHEKILTLRAMNKELKVGVGQELVTTVERRAKELEGEVEKMRTELESLRSQWRELE